MFSHVTFPAVAAIIFAGTAFNSASASPVDSIVAPDSVLAHPVNPHNTAVPSDSDSVPKPPVIGPVSDGAPPVGLPNALERERLKSAVFASPGDGSVDTTDSARFRLPPTVRGDGPRSFEDDWRYRVNPQDKFHGPISQSRQEAADRIGDMIAPGFGRIEFDSGRNKIRIDYLYSRKCKLRGAGICFRMTF